MNHEKMRQQVHQGIDRHCAPLSSDPYRVQRVLNAAHGKGDKIVRKKLSIGLIVAIALMLLTLTAVAMELLSGMQVVEQIAVPIAQENDQKNYTHEELAKLLRTLNENGITLDEGSTIMQAFQSGRGYWERDVIREICIAAFGGSENTWTIEQKHWYGEMLLAIEASNINLWLLPGDGDMTIPEARALGAKALKEAFGADLPIESNDDWIIQEVFNLVWDEETNAFPAEKAEWCFWYTERQHNQLIYSVTLARDGRIIDTWQYPPSSNANHDENQIHSTRYTPLYENEAAAIDQYGRVMHYWPDEVKITVYGAPYAIPSQKAYDQALKIAEQPIQNQFGENAMQMLGEYKIGLLHKALQNAESGVTQWTWDFMFTTDPEYLSDGYRVQFLQTFDEKTGEITTRDLCVETANLGNG